MENGQSEGEYEDKQEETEEESYYQQHFYNVVDTVMHRRREYREFHSVQEQQLASIYCKQLSKSAQGLYSRLFQRKGPWFRVESLLQYREINKNEQDLQQALKQLKQYNLIQEIDSSDEQSLHSVNRGLEAVESCFLANEMQKLAALLNGGRKMKIQKSYKGKQGLFDTIKEVVLTQRCFNGKMLPLIRCMKKTLKDSSKFTSQGDSIVLFRMNTTPRAFFLRVHRLYYRMNISTLGDTTKACGDHWMPTVDTLVVPWVGLTSVLVGQVFVGYSTEIQNNLFINPKDFFCFEIAAELKCAIEFWLDQDAEKMETKLLLRNHPHLLCFRQLTADEPIDDLHDYKTRNYSNACEVLRAMTSIDQLIIEMLECFVAYTKATTGKYHGPQFLRQNCAGNILASCLWESVKVLEKERRYEEANDLLSRLLQSPYMTHKRGRWWDRLALNSEKLGHKEKALDLCNQAVEDAYLSPVDRLTLGTRQKRLSQASSRFADGEFTKSTITMEDVNGIKTIKPKPDDTTGITERVSKKRRKLKEKDINAVNVCTRAKRNHVDERNIISLIDSDTAEEEDSVVASVNSGHHVAQPKIISLIDPDDDDFQNMLTSSYKPSNSRTLRRKRKRLEETKSKEDANAEEFGQKIITVIDSSDEDALDKATKPVEPESTTWENRSIECLKDGGVNYEALMQSTIPQDHIVGRPLNRKSGEKSRFIGFDNEYCTVEELVLQHYHQEEGWYGHHLEGSIVRTVFGVLYWDIIFAPIPDVFQSPYQSAPLDLNFPDLFYSNRKDLFISRSKEIAEWSTSTLVENIEASWHKNYGTICFCVSWDLFPLKYVKYAAAALGPTTIANVSLEFAKVLRHLRGGMPDLFLMRCKEEDAEKKHKFLDMIKHMNENSTASSEDESGDDPENFVGFEAMFVEVKGPRDRLMDRQSIWLRLLQSFQVKVVVAKVIEEENKPKQPQQQ